MNAKVFAIIPTFNRREPLRETLNCLCRQIIPQGYTLETIVVVDGSTDGTKEMLREEFPRVHTIDGDGNWWYTKCINAGILKAGELNAVYIITLNDDVIFDENYISGFLKYTSPGKDIMLGSASFTQNEPHRITFSGIKQLVKWRLKEISYIEKFSVVKIESLKGIKPSVNLSGRGLFFNMAISEKIGLYDENLKQYSSDTDFSYRAYKAGIGVFVTYDSKIFENEKLTSKGALYNKASFSEYFRSLFNEYSVNSLKKSFYYFRKHGRLYLLPVYAGFYFFAVFFVFFTKYRNK